MSDSDREDEEFKIILILDNDPTNSKYRCPLTTCSHHTASVPTIMQHMWKSKKKNAPNKTCTGKESPSLTLYPKLFYDTKFEESTHPTFEQEFPLYNWEIIQKYINPPGDSPPNIISLIQEFDIFVTQQFIDNYPEIKIPKHLKQFILDNDFDPDTLESLLKSIKNPKLSLSPTEPARKKRKTSSTESVDIADQQQPTLLLPSLNISPKDSSHTNSMMQHISNNSSLSFDLNNYDQNHNHNHNTNNLSVLIPRDRSSSKDIIIDPLQPQQTQKSRKRKRRRGIGPICGGCNTEINPCCTMIKCAECINDDIDLNDSIGNLKDVIICIECFKTGKEFGSHKRFHRYNVLRPLTDFKLQDTTNNSGISATSTTKETKTRLQKHNRWQANDEWNLTYGIRKYGLGNWSGITKMINKQSFKGKNEQKMDYKHVESHFDYKYSHIVNNKDMEEKEEKTAGGGRWKASSVSVTYGSRRSGKKHRNKNKEDGNRNNGNKRESKFTDKHKHKCGYKEKRDEFEAEWNNDAEAMIGEMYFSEWDTKDERALKLEGLRLYNKVLDERKVRKKFIKEYGVIYNKKTRGRNVCEADVRLEEEITNNLSAFARYTEDKNHNFTEFKALCKGLAEEKKLRERIYKLRHYLLNGVTSLSVMERIDKYVARQQELKMERDERLALRRQEREDRRRRLRGNDVVSMEEDEDDEDDEDYDIDDVIPETADEYLNRYNGCSLDNIAAYLSLLEAESDIKKKGKTRGRRKSEVKEEKKKDEDVDEEIDDEWVRKWNLKKMKGVGGLSDGEKKLCEVLKCGPVGYEDIKREIARRVYLHGLLGKGKVPQQLYIDIEDVENVKESMKMKIGLVDPQLLVDIDG